MDLGSYDKTRLVAKSYYTTPTLFRPCLTLLIEVDFYVDGGFIVMCILVLRMGV